MDNVDLFLVRVWRDVPHFRASARRIADETAQVFASAGELAQFMAKAADPAPKEDTDAARTATDHRTKGEEP